MYLQRMQHHFQQTERLQLRYDHDDLKKNIEIKCTSLQDLKSKLKADEKELTLPQKRVEKPSDTKAEQVEKEEEEEDQDEDDAPQVLGPDGAHSRLFINISTLESCINISHLTLTLLFHRETSHSLQEAKEESKDKHVDCHGWCGASKEGARCSKAGGCCGH